MKAAFLNIQQDISATYDKLKTTVLGNISTRTINTKQCLGPTQNQFIDCYTDSGATAFVPGSGIALTANNRLFVCSTFAVNIATIMLYNLNPVTGAKTYVGKIQVTLPTQAATTHTLRGFSVLDAGTTGWKIAILTTGSVLINGGVFVVNKVDLADFSQVTATPFVMAQSTDDAKAIYFYQASAELGSLNLHTTGTDLILDTTNNVLYSHNGVSATHQYYSWDMTVAPTIQGAVTCTTPVATPGVVNATAHGKLAGDQVVFNVSGGSLPTGLVAGTVYFVSATGLTANAFQVSATSGGASLNFTVSSTGTQQVRRGFGQTSSAFLAKTGNLPALLGTLLNSNSGEYVTSSSWLAGSDLGFFASTTNIYMGKLSELTSGATTWPSLITANVLGGLTEITVPTASFAGFSEDIDRAFIVTNTSLLLKKGFISSDVDSVFGQVDNGYFETNSSTLPSFGMATVAGFHTYGGALLLSGNVAGQRGVVVTDAKSDSEVGVSKVITPVFPSSGIQSRAIITLEENYSETGNLLFSYRTSNNFADVIFDDETSGWTSVQNGQDLVGVSSLDYSQIKIEWEITQGFSASPAQLVDLGVAYDSETEISDNWEGSVDNSSQAGASPCRTAFRLKTIYPIGFVPPLYFRAYDESGTLVISANTVSNAADFEYSTNNGTSWAALGTIPNTALTTEVRYNWVTPPGVRVSCALKES